MIAVIAVFISALCFALIGTPTARRIAFKLGLISVPRGGKAHHQPTAMLGGVAIFLGVSVALTIVALVASQFLDSWRNLDELAAILAGATIMSFVGLWDDRVNLSPVPKFGLQIVAVIVPIVAGVYIRLPLPDLVNIGLTILWILYVTNAVNFSDNMDGVAAGISASAAAFFTLIAAMNGQFLVSGLAAAVMGACFGFLRYNLPLPRATIFMGDAGALFLGFMLAILGLKLRFPENTNVVTWMVPIIVLGVPLFDTTMVFISRFRRGDPLMKGGVDHLSHRLERAGLGKLGTSLALALAGGALGMVAVFITQAGLIDGYVLGGMTFLVALYAFWRVEWLPSLAFRTGKEDTTG